jgi:hypothetical protein
MKDIANKIVDMLTNKGRVDNGFEIPTRGYNSFTNNPTNIKKAILKPTENRTVFAPLLKFNLKIWRMRNPGIKEMQTKPIICLIIGISRVTAVNIANWVASIGMRESFISCHLEGMHETITNCY